MGFLHGMVPNNGNNRNGTFAVKWTEVSAKLIYRCTEMYCMHYSWQVFYSFAEHVVIRRSIVDRMHAIAVLCAARV